MRLHAGQHQPRRGPDLIEGPQHHVLILGTGHNANSAPGRLPADACLPLGYRNIAHRQVDPLGYDTVGNNSELPLRCALPDQGLPDGPADRDHLGSESTHQPVFEEEGSRHPPVGNDKRRRQTPSEHQPGERLTISRALRVDHIDGVTSHEAGQSRSVGPLLASKQTKRVDLETSRPSKRFDFGAGWADEANVQPRACESQTEMQR